MKKVDDHPVDVDSLHRGGFAVEGSRAHRLAEPRSRDEQRQSDHQRRRRQDHHDPDDRDVERPPVDARGEIDVLVGLIATEVGAEEEQRGRLEEEGDAERRDQRGDPRGVSERPVGEALDHDPKQPGPEHRDPQHDRDQRDDVDRQLERAAKCGEHSVAGERAHHVDLAVREVEELQDPVDHRVAERDQSVDAPERHPVDELLHEEVPVHRSDPLTKNAVRPTPKGEPHGG